MKTLIPHISSSVARRFEWALKRVPLLVAFALLPLLGACGDDAAPIAEEKPGISGPSYISVSISAPVSRGEAPRRSPAATGSKSPAGGENGDGEENGINNESNISHVSLIVYPKPKDGKSINTPDADKVKVRVFCWDVRPVMANSGMASKLEYTTGARPLPEDISYDTYEMLIVANEDLTHSLDGKMLDVVRDHIIYRIPFERNDLTQGDKLYHPELYTNFLMTSLKPVEIVIGDGVGHIGTGSQTSPFQPKDGTINLERLAARIDFVPDMSGSSVWNATDKTYDYPVYDSDNNRVATFKLEYCFPFNITKQQYLFKHTTAGKDTTAVNCCGRETFEQGADGLSHASNYVLDPRSLQGKTSGLKGLFFIETFFHDNLVQNLNALKQYQHVKAPDQLSAPDENGRRSYILEYSAENTHTFQFLSDKTVRYTQYCAGIRINGKYVRNGAAPSTAKYVSFDWIIRHSAPDGVADISRPMLYGLVRNNIYRIYISKIRSIDGDFSVQFKVKVVPWQRYEHLEIPM